jgi:hypothetical protein
MATSAQPPNVRRTPASRRSTASAPHSSTYERHHPTATG